MKILSLIHLLMLLGCSRESTKPVKIPAPTNTATITIPTLTVVTPSTKTLPTWYVFKIKAFHQVTFSDDKTFAIVEGTTMSDKEFKVKLVWDEPFKETHPRSIDRWLKKSKADFAAGIPYVIAGKVVSRNPLIIEPDTVVANAPNFGAPPENVY